MFTIKKSSIVITFLSLAFSTCFWLIRDINSIIAENGIQGVSDLSRYYAYYNEIDFDLLLTIDWYKGLLFYVIFYLFKNIGISFEVFLFFIINLYFIVFAKLAKNALKTEKIYVTIIILGALSFWLVPAVTVVLRQGLAILLIAIFFNVLNRKSNYLLKSLIVLLIVNIHFTAIIILPLVLFWSYFKKYLLLIDALFLMVLMLYIINAWYFLSDQILALLSDISIFSAAIAAITNSDYVVGFSIYKMAAFLLPIIIYRFPVYFGYHHRGDAGVYILFVYFSITGMILSGLPYHDRIFLYGWTFSPILIASIFTVARKKYE